MSKLSFIPCDENIVADFIKAAQMLKPADHHKYQKHFDIREEKEEDFEYTTLLSNFHGNGHSFQLRLRIKKM